MYCKLQMHLPKEKAAVNLKCMEYKIKLHTAMNNAWLCCGFYNVG